MKKFIFAALLALTSLPAFADGISCPEMAKMINDYESKKRSGNMNRSEKETVPSILAASYKSFDSAGCSKSLLKNSKK